MKKRSLLIACGVIVLGVIASIAWVPQTKEKELVGKRAFPQHTVYQAGTIKPDNVSQEDLDSAVANFYKAWKNEYLKQPAAESDQYYIFYNDKGYAEPKNAVTVSEAHGYGMMITAIMAGSQDKQYFDGLYRFYKAHGSDNDPSLMAWQQVKDKSGKIINTPGDADSATDGDMDIAYSLLLADRQWGSEGEIDYLASAKEILAAIMSNEINRSQSLVKLGDWAEDKDEVYGRSTRSSDLLLNHFKSFEAAAGTDEWKDVTDKAYAVIHSIYEEKSGNTGLMPDFIVQSREEYQPAQANFLEGENDGNYSWNSSRTPWRYTIDYLLTGDERALPQLKKMNDWIKAETDGNPDNIQSGYTLSGKAVEEGNSTTFVAPFMVSAMVDSSNQKWINQLWDRTIQKQEDDDYFANTIKLQTMIVASGNWWAP
ncbi:glycosyl hydrolase family 8 [Peribacillus simplex]|uniref:glycosyl hydrolase family 8 n=1 Tax=Peribacillus TaxID=2675229 RepID=UPI0017858BF3|nr:glycosyl hydrolase family 8 [Brevibacillus sp. JNUCC-41]QOS91215.1 beta-glucanase [Brevibacillus sp. JNUCC-41]